VLQACPPKGAHALVDFATEREEEKQTTNKQEEREKTNNNQSFLFFVFGPNILALAKTRD